MCGIIGIMSTSAPLPLRTAEFFNDAMFFNQLRGTHSAGAMLMFDDDDSEVFKENGPFVTGLAENKAFAKELNYQRDITAIVGHCRQATRGKVNKANAHPFNYENITLVHNGSLEYGWDELLVEDVNMQLAIDVDSEAVCYAIAHNGLKWTADRMFGAYSLVWFDDNEKSVNFYRNEARPMWWIYAEGTICFGSEPAMVLAAMERNGIKATSVAEVPVHTHIKITYSDDSVAITTEQYKPQLVAQKARTIQTTYQTNFNQWQYNTKKSAEQIKPVVISVTDNRVAVPSLVEIRNRSSFTVRGVTYNTNFPISALREIVKKNDFILFSYDEGEAEKEYEGSELLLRITGQLLCFDGNVKVSAVIRKSDFEVVKQGIGLVGGVVRSVDHDPDGGPTKLVVTHCTHTRTPDPYRCKWFHRSSVLSVESLRGVGK